MSHESNMRALQGAANDVAAYAGSPGSSATVAWVDALLAVYAEEFAEVTQSELPELQGKVKQLRELRKLLTAAIKTNGHV